MAGLFQKLFKATSASPSATPVDADFAEFATVSEPVASVTVPQPSAATDTISPRVRAALVDRPYTKWYRVWERTTPRDFIQEAFVFPFILFILIFHFWGTRTNRRKARQWAQFHVPILQNEFEVVGYTGFRKAQQQPASNSLQTDASSSDLDVLARCFKDQAANEYTTYATGRQNVAFLDVSIKMAKRYNPVVRFGESIAGFLFESMPALVERVEMTSYSFDGREKFFVSTRSAAEQDQIEQRNKANSSAYDGFVFAITHKNCMRQLRQDRYDVSLTATKDNPKLPEWSTVMSESAEITDTVLTPDLIKAVEEANQVFEYLIITDQPVDKPKTLEEASPRKRIILSLRLPSGSSTALHQPTLAIFNQFLRLTDRLVSAARFRPEVARKLRNTRDEEVKKLKRVSEDEKAEERRLAAEKVKKDERERLLRGMSAEEQRKYLEKEREREQKRGMKKNTLRA